MDREQDDKPAAAVRRPCFIIKGGAAALLCFYAPLTLVDVIMGWLHILGIRPVLILSASVCGLMHAA